MIEEYFRRIVAWLENSNRNTTATSTKGFVRNEKNVRPIVASASLQEAETS